MTVKLGQKRCPKCHEVLGWYDSGWSWWWRCHKCHTEGIIFIDGSIF